MNDVKKTEKTENNNNQGGNLEDSDNFELSAVKVTSGLFMIHFIAMVLKRALYFKRDTRGFVCEIFLPILVVIGGLSILLVEFIYDAPKVDITVDLYSTP